MNEQKNRDDREGAWQIFWIFLRLGCTAFGGPIAHLGYFREAFVVRRRWLSEDSYGELVSLCHFLPGPASSQVGISLGLTRGGYSGAVAAWAGFTLPSAIALIVFALMMTHENVIPAGALHGLKVVAVAVVAQAVWGMAKNLCAGIRQLVIMATATAIALFIPTPLGQVMTIVLSGCAGLILFVAPKNLDHEPLPIPTNRRTGLFYLALFFIALVGLPFLDQLLSNQTIADIASFYRSGALVFGGGHVVLPLLQAAVVPQGLVSTETFMAGYGAAQAVPGPLFTFAAFLGAAMSVNPTGWLGGLICLVAIFAPSFLLVFGVLPFWQDLRRNRKAQAAIIGINAAVVGILLAALYQPVWSNGIISPQDFAMALVAFIALVVWKTPLWLVVMGCASAGWLMNLAG